MRIKTKLFGEIEIEEEKVISFENGIIGYPELRKFTLIYDEDDHLKKRDRTVIWLQSLDEQDFALPVINPLMIKEDYDPHIEEELLKPLGDVTGDNACILVTMTVPKDIKKMAVNLKAPLVINVDTRKGDQVIVEEDYQVHYEVYEMLKAAKEKDGE